MWAMVAAALSALSNVSANASLRLNSVGTYQLSKLTTVPMTCVLEKIMLGMEHSQAVHASLYLLVAGVGLATVSDLELSVVGLGCGLVGAFGTSLYSIVVKLIQQKGKVSGMQFIFQTAPWIALFEAPFIFVTDDLGRLLDFPYTAIVVGLVACTCVLALGLCYSYVVVVEKTSPLTLQVLGHVKTMLIFVLGFFLFNSPVVVKNVLGMVIAFLAVVGYSYAKLHHCPVPSNTISALAVVVVTPSSASVKSPMTWNSRERKGSFNGESLESLVTQKD